MLNCLQGGSDSADEKTPARGEGGGLDRGRGGISAALGAAPCATVAQAPTVDQSLYTFGLCKEADPVRSDRAHRYSLSRAS